jgi:hypothetical protein
MKVILDASIIYSSILIQSRLSSGIITFLKACDKKGHEIIITLTTKLEFDRKQNEARRQKIQDLKNASELLKEFQIDYEKFNPEDLVKTPDLILLLKEQVKNVTLVEPKIEDFNYAHEKACLHLPPHPPDIKSDEMRDLIVWKIALRIASESSGTLLVSNDRLHLNQSGDEEASKVNLVRVNNLEAAMDYLDVETPNGKIIQILLVSLWKIFLENNLPIVDNPLLKGISNVKFIQGKDGPSDVFFHLKVLGLNDKEFQSDIKIHLEDKTITNVQLSNNLYDEKAMGDKSLNTSINVNFFENDFLDRLNSLKSIIS